MPRKTNWRKVAILNSEHLFEQAEKLIVAPPEGPPRQVDVRRAISAAYYGVFHHVCTRAADHLIGIGRRSDRLYGMAYRSVDHRWLKELCQDVGKSTPQCAPFMLPGGFAPNPKNFAAIAVELQTKRHVADYDPLVRLKTSDAALAVDAGRAAVVELDRSGDVQKSTFLTLLLFPPRRS